MSSILVQKRILKYGKRFFALLVTVISFSLLTPSDAQAQEAAFPFEQEFDGTPPNTWVVRGDAQWNTSIDGVETVRLTQAQQSQSGLVFYDQGFSSEQGIVAEFRYNAEGGGGGNMGFFLVDGDQVDSSNISAGVNGQAFGYAAINGNPGVPHAYMGVSFDPFGATVDGTNGLNGGSGNGIVPDSVGIRGEGNGTTGYAYLTSTQISADPINETIDGGWRRVRIAVDPTAANTTLRIEMSFDEGETWQTVIDDYTYEVAPPSNVKLGMVGTTGGAFNRYAVDYLNVELPVNLETTVSGLDNAPYARGEEVTYTYTVTNNGPNDSSVTTVFNDMPLGENGFTDVSWTSEVSGGGETASGTGANIGTTTANVPDGESVTYTVTGTVGNDVTQSTDLSPNISADPGPNRINPNESAGGDEVVVATDVPTAEASLLDRTTSYASSTGTTTAPSVNDYLNGGVTGVDDDNVDEVNEIIAESDADEVDTVAEIQDTVDAQLPAQNTIVDYADSSGTTTAPTTSTYDDRGVTGVDDENLAEVNDAIASSTADAVDTQEEVQEIIDEITAENTVEDYAETNGTSTTPTVKDYEDVDTSGATEDNIDELNQAVAASDPSAVDTAKELQDIINDIVSSQNNTPGIIVTETDGDTTVSSDKPNDTVTARLATRPTSDVTVTYTAEAPMEVAPQTLTFTPDNWDEPQDITVSLADDADLTGEREVSINASITTTAVDYQNINPGAQGVRIDRNEGDDEDGDGGGALIGLRSNAGEVTRANTLEETADNDENSSNSSSPSALQEQLAAIKTRAQDLLDALTTSMTQNDAIESESTTVSGSASSPSQTCEAYITDTAMPGARDVGAGTVTKLQTYLTDYEEIAVPATGYYGTMTENAVRQFQTKYASDVLLPWGYTASEATGNLYYTTRKKINKNYCQAQGYENAAFPLSAAQQQEVNATASQ